MPSKSFSKLFTSCYAGEEHSRGRKKNKREVPEFMDEVSLGLTTQTYELTDNTTGQHIYAIPFKNKKSLSSDYDLDSLPGENFSHSSSLDTSRMSHYNDTFTIDIIPGSNDENSRRILQKLTEDKQKTSTLKRKDTIDRNKLLINESNGYAKIIKTPKSKKKPILPQSPVLNFAKKPLLPKSGLSSSNNSYIDKNNSISLSKTVSKDSLNILEDNYNEVKGICSSMINFCESPNNIKNNIMSSSGYILSGEKKNLDKSMGASYSDPYSWRTAAFSGTNQRSLDALINPNLRPSIHEIPPSIREIEFSKKENNKYQISNSTSKKNDLAYVEDEHQKIKSKSIKMIDEKEVIPTEINSHTSFNLSNKRKLKLNISKSEESLSRPIKLKVFNKEKKCFEGRMICCSPVTNKRRNNKKDTISQGSQSSEYNLKILNTSNKSKKKQPVSKCEKNFSPNHQIEKHCEEYSSSGSCSSISTLLSTSSLINTNNTTLTSKENENIKTKDGKLCIENVKSSCNATKEFNDLKVQKVKLRQKEKIIVMDKKYIPINNQNFSKKDIVEKDMSMVATVYPFQRSSNSHDEMNEKNDDEGVVKDHYENQSDFRIEDVTDDPNYQVDDNKNENDNYEGSLVEYCRLDPFDKDGKFNPRNSIFEAVTYRQSPSDNDINNMISSLKDSKISDKERNNYRYSFIQPNYDSNGNIFEEVGKICPYSEETMANILDIAVGEPCINEKKCKCHGFAPHKWSFEENLKLSKVCVHCKCDRNDHEIGGNKYLTVYERLGITPSAEMADVMRTVRNDAPGQVGHGYSWVPPGLSRVKVEEYMSQLPNHLVPRTNSAGEKHRERQLIMQLPRQDLSSAYCKHLKTPIERKVYEEFVNARNEVALDIGYVDAKLSKSSVCSKCNGIMEKGDLAVIAPKLGEQNTWHPACFTCKTCDQLLIDLTYCVRENSIYCERHYAELHKPRCSACDEVSF
uniref:LIM zinc-binding domain-containing protein n=1 Tax=Strongyloides stercoralis TaxID=6248 RepID=A0AAF5D9R8_STRER